MARITRTFTRTDSLLKPPPQYDAYSDDNGLTWRWVSSNQVMDPDTCRSYDIPCDPAAQAKARQVYIDSVMASYSKNQPAQPSAEQLAEARAAYGPGVDVVDVVSGRKFRT